MDRLVLNDFYWVKIKLLIEKSKRGKAELGNILGILWFRD